MNEDAVIATPEQRRPWIEVGSLARTIAPGMVLPADLSGMELIDAVQRTPGDASTCWSSRPARCTACWPRPTSTTPSPASDGALRAVAPSH